VIRPLDGAQLAASFEEYQRLLPQLLTASDYQDAGKDRDGKPRRFVKKSGWRKIATAFDLDVLIVRSHVERDADGQPLRAEVWARAVSPAGRMMDGDGYCAADEERFKDPRGRGKLENDLRATATTRAMSRAISGLIGMSADSSDAGPTDPAHPYGPPVPEQHVRQVSEALIALAAGDVELARRAWEEITRVVGYVPDGAGRALVAAARTITPSTAAAGDAA
jgi:hypothetical protein